MPNNSARNLYAGPDMPPENNSIRKVLTALGLATISATGQAACVGNPAPAYDAGPPRDASPQDALPYYDVGNIFPFDSGADAALEDAATSDASADAATSDASADAATSDASVDAATDGG